MSATDLAKIAAGLPPEDRIELARRIVESLDAEVLDAAIAEGILRLEDLSSGHVTGLTEDEYRAALQ